MVSLFSNGFDVQSTGDTIQIRFIDHLAVLFSSSNFATIQGRTLFAHLKETACDWRGQTDLITDSNKTTVFIRTSPIIVRKDTSDGLNRLNRNEQSESKEDAGR